MLHIHQLYFSNEIYSANKKKVSIWKPFSFDIKKTIYRSVKIFHFLENRTESKITDFSLANSSWKESYSIDVRLLRVLQHEESWCALSTHMLLPLLHGFAAFVFVAYRTITFAIANLPESAERKKIVRRGLIALSLLTDGGCGLKR